MKPAQPSSIQSIRNRRIGRKVLQADRLAKALSSKAKSKSGYKWSFPSLRPRVVATACAVMILVSALGFGGTQYYAAQAATKQRSESIARDSEMKAKGVAAEACRQQKVEQKSELIGKITYDEMYDHGECDK